jgi:release factor glutamine methyltransferase
MKIKEVLLYASKIIVTRWKDTPLLDAQVIMQNLMGIPKESLITLYNENFPNNLVTKFNAMVEKRVEGFPVAYLTNKKEFYGRIFYVDNSVLIPRADTEILVETAIKSAEKIIKEHIKILDLCTGSGCIAITLKCELGDKATVEAADISGNAKNVFLKNCKNLFAGNIVFYKSNLFEAIHDKYDIIVSNPPYLCDFYVNEMIKNNWPEPEIALRGGDDGLKLIKKIIEESQKYIEHGGCLCMEADPGQMKNIEKHLTSNNFNNVYIEKDLAGKERVITGWKL